MQNPTALPNHYGPVSGEKEPELVFVALNPGVCWFFSYPPLQRLFHVIKFVLVLRHKYSKKRRLFSFFHYQIIILVAFYTFS